MIHIDQSIEVVLWAHYQLYISLKSLGVAGFIQHMQMERNIVASWYINRAMSMCLLVLVRFGPCLYPQRNKTKTKRSLAINQKPWTNWLEDEGWFEFMALSLMNLAREETRMNLNINLKSVNGSKTDRKCNTWCSYNLSSLIKISKYKDMD